MACCDAQHIGRVDRIEGAVGMEPAQIPMDARENLSAHVEPGRPLTAAGHASADAHARAERGARIDAPVNAAAHASGDAHAGGAPSALINPHVGAKTPRAKQSIPPAIRRLVLRRDGGRCRVPGFRHATFVDVHHLDPRSEGGGNDPENLATLCPAHHRANHRGELVVEGRPTTGLRFFHADGTAYGGSLSATVAAVRAKACRALQGMGYREKEAKRALALIPADSELDLKQVIVKALREMPAAARHARS